VIGILSIRRVPPSSTAANTREGGCGNLSGHRGEGLGFADFEILDGKTRFLQCSRAASEPPRNGGRIVGERNGNLSQDPRETRREAALLGRQIGVARRQSEAVRLADRRYADNSHRDIEVAYQPLHDHQLLVILFAEIRGVRESLDQQLGYDRRNTVEVTGTVPAAQAFREAGDAHGRRKTGRVHLIDRRHEDEINPRRSQHLKVGRLAPRVGTEILTRRELLRIDKYRRNDAIAFSVSCPYQHHMTFMQCAHRRHQPDSLLRLAPEGDVPSQIADGAPNFHR
jgi:hypothetical protein